MLSKLNTDPLRLCPYYTVATHTWYTGPAFHMWIKKVFRKCPPNTNNIRQSLNIPRTGIMAFYKKIVRDVFF